MDIFAEKFEGLSSRYLVRNAQGKLSGMEIADASGILLDGIRNASARQWLSAAGILVSNTDKLCQWRCAIGLILISMPLAVSNLFNLVDGIPVDPPSFREISGS